MSHSSLSNPHPYAIKTTSTGILSRSASNKSSSSSHNHYVPISPSPSSSPTRPSYSNHKYSGSTDDIPRPLPVPPPNQQHDQQQYAASNPNFWSPEELALNIPQVADFVNRYDISGRAFLRLDNGVLDAYGISHDNDLRITILTASHRLRQTVRRLHRSEQQQQQQDQAYLSSSSSISATSPSPTSTMNPSAKKRRHQHQSSTGSSSNGRVYGMVASFERERSGSFSSNSSVDDDDRPRSSRFSRTAPGPEEEHSFRTASPASSSSSTFGTPQPTTTSRDTSSTSRPLPSIPTHPSLLPRFDDSDGNDNENENASSSAEMTIEDIVGSLNEDKSPSASAKALLAAAKGRYSTGQDHTAAASLNSLPNDKDDNDEDVFNPCRAITEGGRRRGRKQVLRGAAAWEMMDSLEPGQQQQQYGETVKRIVSSVSVSVPAPVGDKGNGEDEELSIEELLALTKKKDAEVDVAQRGRGDSSELGGDDTIVGAGVSVAPDTTTVDEVTGATSNTNKVTVDNHDDDGHRDARDDEQPGWDLSKLPHNPTFPFKKKAALSSRSQREERSTSTSLGPAAGYNVRTGKGKSKRKSIEDLFFAGPPPTEGDQNRNRNEESGTAHPSGQEKVTTVVTCSESLPGLASPLPSSSVGVDETNKLVEALRERLEVLEKRVEELAASSVSTAAAAAAAASAPTSTVPVATPAPVASRATTETPRDDDVPNTKNNHTNNVGVGVGVFKQKLRELLVWTTMTTTTILPAALSIPLLEFAGRRGVADSGGKRDANDTDTPTTTTATATPDSDTAPTNASRVPRRSRNRYHHQDTARHRYVILVLGIGVCAMFLRGIGMMRKGGGGLRGVIMGLPGLGRLGVGGGVAGRR